jgi:hypothetical protein
VTPPYDGIHLLVDEQTEKWMDRIFGKKNISGILFSKALAVMCP